jgi:hypothetical protein
MNKVRVIGDVHGKIDDYIQILESTDLPSVQVGDLGVGFVQVEPLHTWGNHRFIRGNHDSPHLAKQRDDYIPDGTVEGSVGYIGGAYSIDAAYRTPGINWWYDEECSASELEHIVDTFTVHQPKVIISHDCPTRVARFMCNRMQKTLYDTPNRTAAAMDLIYDVYAPKLHIFGHWHRYFDEVYKGTRIICLPELSFIDIDLDLVYDHDAFVRYI